jgi:hypothetical protein
MMTRNSFVPLDGAAENYTLIHYPLRHRDRLAALARPLREPLKPHTRNTQCPRIFPLLLTSVAKALPVRAGTHGPLSSDS